MKHQLLIGCGRRRDRLVRTPIVWQPLRWTRSWDDLTTLDINPTHEPDIIHDLEDPRGLPFKDDYFDEIHAYEVLEHVGQQGDWRFFFQLWQDFWRVLKPNGEFYATCPSYRSQWAWGDPSHKNVVTSGKLSFLSQKMYKEGVGNTSMSDFRFVYKADYEIVYCAEDDETLEFVLRALK